MSEESSEIKTFTPEEVSIILENHKKWVNGKEGGTRANLYGANLYGANLDGANLYGANLDGANLDGANLYGANLDGANLDGANLYGAKYGEDTLRGVLLVGPIGSRKSTLQVFGIGDEGFVFRAGCFTGSADEFTVAVKNEHGENLHAVAYLAAIEFAKVMLPAVVMGELAEVVNE